MQKRTRGGLIAVSFSFLCPLPSVCQNRGEKSDDPKSLKKIYIYLVTIESQWSMSEMCFVSLFVCNLFSESRRCAKVLGKF